jgi:hypothetical protein
VDGGTASRGGEKRDAARNLDASDAVATRRRLGCDYTARPLAASECPSSLPSGFNDYNCDGAACGELCDGDGECGTTNGENNCPDLGDGGWDLYQKVCDWMMRAPPSETECKDAVAAAGLSEGECGHSFAGNYKHDAGCYSYFSGSYSPCGYWSTSGSPTSAKMSRDDTYKVMMCDSGWIAPLTEADCKEAIEAAGMSFWELDPLPGLPGFDFNGDGYGCHTTTISADGSIGFWSTAANAADPSMGYSSQAEMRRWDDGACLAQFDNNWKENCEDDREWCDPICRDLCEDGGAWGIQLRGCCPETCNSVPDVRLKICLECAAGKYSQDNTCVNCKAGTESNDAHTDCVSCGDGYYSSSAGTMCTPCAAGKESNNAHTDCEPCGPGYISSAGSMCTTQCPAGKASNGAHTACDTCAAGTYSSAGSSVCTTCPFGKYSGAGQATCTNCGDAGYAGYLESLWDPNQSGLASEDECKCRTGRTGANCEQEMCATNTPVVSLGFLLLEVQWPRHMRELSRNEAFSGISAAFRAFDANGDHYLNVTEARTGIADGSMAVPLEVSHIWSSVENGERVEIHEAVDSCTESSDCSVEGQYCLSPSGYCCVGSTWVAASTCRGDVTIADMIQDELQRLDTQQTRELYDQPSGSGAITKMEATYPNPLTHSTLGDRSCLARNELPPILEWTVYRGDNVIFQQCAFLNGEVLSGADGLDNEVSDGKSNIAPSYTDCRGPTGAVECKFDFNLDDYEVKDYYERLERLELLTDIEQRQNCDVVPITDSSECPPASTLAEVLGDDKQCDNVLCGELCEGDGECGTTNSLDSCGTYDVYRKQCGEVLDISKHSYCVQTKFCPPDSGTCDKTNTQIKVTTRCTTGLQYDGTPMDVFPRMLGQEGVSISWLDTSTVATGYRVYKYNPSEPFVGDTSRKLLREVATSACGLTHNYVDFRDVTTGSEPALQVGYAIVPLDAGGDEISVKVGVTGFNSATAWVVSSTSSGFIVTWFADVQVKVEAEGGGPVKGVTVEVGHLVNALIDPNYPMGFVSALTDEYGEATLEIRVQDRSWFSKTQHFNVTVEKTSIRQDGTTLEHDFSPSSEVVAVKHLGEAIFEFTDTTSKVISGTVSHAGFHAAYFADDCPHTKFQFVADSFVVSGSTDEDQDGTYRLDGMCESLPYYGCETCGSDQYIWYDTGKWYIGSGGCGTTSAGIRVDDANKDLEDPSGSWEEWDGSTFGSSPVSVTVTALTSYTKVDTEECMCPVDGVEVWIIRESGPKQVTVNNGRFSTAVFDGELVTLYLRRYYGVTGSSDCDGPDSSKDQFPDDATIGNLHCIGVTDGNDNVIDLVDVLEVKSGNADGTTCSCPDGYAVWDPQSYEHADAVDRNQTVPADYKAGIYSSTDNYGYTPNDQCRKYLCSSNAIPHEFSVTGDTDGDATVKNGVFPTFTYTANEDAQVHFRDTSTLSLSARLVHGSAQDTATYVSGVPIVASVERCGWEQPAWTLRGEAVFWLGAAKFDVRMLGANAVDEAKYYYPHHDQRSVVPDCDDDTLSRDDMVRMAVSGPLVNGTDIDSMIMLRGCRAKIPDVSASATERLQCASTKYTYVDELPASRNFEKDLSNLRSTVAKILQAPAEPTSVPMPGQRRRRLLTSDDPVTFEIVSPLCLDSVTATGSGLQYLVDDTSTTREPGYGSFGQDSAESLLLLSELPAPEEDGLYGKACTTNTGAVFREGDVVNLEFTLVEREPDCAPAAIYPWDACPLNENAPTTSHDIKIRVADGVSGEEYGETCPSTDPNDTCLASSYETDLSFMHEMKVGEPNPFAPFSHELSVEFSRAYDDAEILFVRHVLILGSIPEEVPQVWTVATNPTLIFSIIRDPPGGASTATLVEGSTISTSMAIDGSHAAQLEDSFRGGLSVGGAARVSGGACMGGVVLKNVVSKGFQTGLGYATTPVDMSVSRSTSRHFDIGISFSTAISTSDSPYLAGQPSDVIIGGGANLRFISAIEIYAKADSVTGGLCLGGLTAMEFLPEQISTWVMSVYEIEKTIERIGAALTDPNTKIEKKNASDASIPDPRDDLVKQIENWRTVLANYRAATVKDQAESVADQLERELDDIHANFESFLKDTTKGEDENRAVTDQFSDFLSQGLNELETGYAPMISYRRPHNELDNSEAEAEEARQSADVWARQHLKTYETDLLDRVNNAYAECVDKVTLVEPDGEARLCDVYSDIYKKLELKESLFGICDFKDGLASVKRSAQC